MTAYTNIGIYILVLPLSYFATSAGRSQPLEFLGALPKRDGAQIRGDLFAYCEYRDTAPISWRPIKGQRPMFEIRTGGFRSYCVVHKLVFWVLHIGRKKDQQRDIETAAKRMKDVFGG